MGPTSRSRTQVSLPTVKPYEREAAACDQIRPICYGVPRRIRQTGKTLVVRFAQGEPEQQAPPTIDSRGKTQVGRRGRDLANWAAQDKV